MLIKLLNERKFDKIEHFLVMIVSFANEFIVYSSSGIRFKRKMLKIW